MSERDDVVTRMAGPLPPAVAAAVDGRANILAMTEAAHDAALTPKDPGGLSHALRAALAERVSRLHADNRMAAHFRELLQAAGADETLIAIAALGDGAPDPAVAAMVAYTDRVAKAPREMTAADITALQAAGVGDPDIVRLAELNAFLAYQLRVIAGLRLLGANA